MWSNPKCNPCLTLIWLNCSALLPRVESCGCKPANIRVKSDPVAACTQGQRNQFVVALQPLCAGLVPPKIIFNHAEMIYFYRARVVLDNEAGKARWLGKCRTSETGQRHRAGLKVMLHGWEIGGKKAFNCWGLWLRTSQERISILMKLLIHLCCHSIVVSDVVPKYFLYCPSESLQHITLQWWTLLNKSENVMRFREKKGGEDMREDMAVWPWEILMKWQGLI